MSKPYPEQCCRFCEDYLAPNQWYFSICDWSGSSATSPETANNDSGFPKWYYWESSLHTALSDLLLNFQFPGMTADNISSVNYSIGIELGPEYDQTLYLYLADNPLSPKPEASAYQQHFIHLSGLRLEITVVDSCSNRRLFVRIKWGSASSDLGTVESIIPNVPNEISNSSGPAITGDIDTRCPQDLVIPADGNHQVASFVFTNHDEPVRFIRIPLHGTGFASPPENPLSPPVMTLSHNSEIGCA